MIEVLRYDAHQLRDPRGENGGQWISSPSVEFDTGDLFDWKQIDGTYGEALVGYHETGDYRFAFEGREDGKPVARELDLGADEMDEFVDALREVETARDNLGDDADPGIHEQVWFGDGQHHVVELHDTGVISVRFGTDDPPTWDLYLDPPTEDEDGDVTDDLDGLLAAIEEIQESAADNLGDDASRSGHPHILDNGVCLTCHQASRGVRHVRTAAGAKKYGLPIGSVIVADGPAKAVKAVAKVAEKVAEPKKPAARTSLKDRLVGALKAHLDGKGESDPLAGYDREQLRRVAKARGIDLDRGESRESIGAKLLDHIRGEQKPQSDQKTPTRAPEPSKSAPPPTPKPTARPPATTPVTSSSGYTGPLFAWSSKRKEQLADELVALKVADRVHGYDWDRSKRADAIGEEADFSRTELQRIEQLALIERNFDQWRKVQVPGVASAKVKEDVARRSREAFAGKPVAVRVTPQALGSILSDGRFKSQFETNTSNGLLDQNVRASAEERWFGLPFRGTDPKKRPIYGYVAVDGVRPGSGTDGEEYLDQYGNIQVILKDTVRSRTTAMWGDSLNQPDYGIPEPIDNPTWRSYTTPLMGAASGELINQHRDVNSQTWRDDNYVEAQIHGGVSTGDIAEVVFGTQPSKQLRDMLEKSGVAWRVM